jgi:hypothetical protein
MHGLVSINSPETGKHLGAEQNLLNILHQSPNHHILPAPHCPTSRVLCQSVREVAPELIGCPLLKRQAGGELLGGMITEL